MDANPQALALFERFALDLAARGQRFGINLIRERVRWECSFAYSGAFKVCNTHSPYIARRLIQRHPHLADHLDLRETRA